MRRLFAPPMLVVALAGLAGCGDVPSEDPLATLDRELAADGSDPVVAAILADPIMTDTALTARANGTAVRPPPGPYTAPIPPADVAARGSTADLIARERLNPAPAAQNDGCSECASARDALTLVSLAEPLVGSCAAALRYSTGWVTRLPANVPVLPNTRLMEAAGAATDGCDVRVVRFWSDLTTKSAIDWYFTSTRSAGYSFTRQNDETGDRIGGRHPDGSRFVLFVDPRERGGADMVLVTFDTLR